MEQQQADQAPCTAWDVLTGEGHGPAGQAGLTCRLDLFSRISERFFSRMMHHTYTHMCVANCCQCCLFDKGGQSARNLQVGQTMLACCCRSSIGAWRIAALPYCCGWASMLHAVYRLMQLCILQPHCCNSGPQMHPAHNGQWHIWA